MWGSHSIGTYVGIALVVALLIAFAFLGSPIIALIIVIPLGVFGFVAMSRSRGMEEPGRNASARSALTAEGSPTSPTGSRTGGAPASGEGEI
jgi:hypothetical protein